ncbi:MAG TPA: hypothetical protein VLB81_04535, partial [Gaiellales bacterium]|nr:hypothetical protein [Gaiellales bacterium]
MAERTMQRPDAPLAGAELALPYLLEDGDFASFARRAAAGATRARVSEPLLSALVAALWTSRAGLEPRGLAVLVGDDDAARTLCEAAAAFLPGQPVAFMPSRGAAHGSGLDPAPHLAGERARALHTLAAGGLVAVSADALVERLPPPAARPAPVELRLGEERLFDELTHELAAAGYERAHSVEERGQFSVRGGLVDIFPSTGREPVRAEFFGDSLERLSAFSAFTQRSLRDLDRVVIHAATESETTGSDPNFSWGEGDEGVVPEGLVSPLPELAGSAALVAWNPEALAVEVDDASAEAAELLRDPEALRRGYVPAAEARELIDDATALEEMPLGQPASFDAQPPALASFGVAEAENELRSLQRAGYRVLVCFPHLGEARRTQLQLRRVEAGLPDPGGSGPEEAGVAFCVGQVRRG